MKLAILCGEIAGLDGGNPGVSADLRDSVALVSDVRDSGPRVRTHNVTELGWFRAVPSRKVGGKGGSKFIGHFGPGTCTVFVQFNHAPPGWAPRQVFYRGHHILPADTDTWDLSFRSPESPTRADQYVKLDPSGAGLLYTTDAANPVLRQTVSGFIQPHNTRWNPVIIAFGAHPTLGFMKAWNSFNFDDAPNLSYTGDTLRLTESGTITSVYLNMPPFYSCLDDVTIQDISQRFTKAFGTTPTGSTVSWYTSVGAVAATASVTVAGGPVSSGQLVIGGLTLTGVLGARTSGSNDFDYSGDAAATALDIIAAINDPLNQFSHICTASSGGSGVVILTAAVLGAARNSTTNTVAYGASYTPTAFTGGVDGALKGTASLDNYYVGLEATNKVKRGVAGYSLVQSSAPAYWNFQKKDDPIVGAVYVSTAAWSANVDTPDGGLDADSGLPPDSYFAPGLLPDGAGDVTGLAPTGSGSNYLNVNTPLGAAADTTYNTATTSGEQDLYTFASTTITALDVSRIVSVTAMARVDRDSTDIQHAEISVKTGSTQSYGLGMLLSDAYALQMASWTHNPDTGVGWTIAQVNALQAGVRFST